MFDKQISVTLTQTAWQLIVNLLDQERNVVKAIPRDTSTLGPVLDFIQDGIVSGMTNTIDSICQQAGVLPGQKVE